MLPKNAQAALDGWISATAPVVQKIYGQSDTGWPEVRAQYMDGLARLFPANDGASFKTTTLANIPAMEVAARSETVGRTLLYIHGGGYVRGGVEGYRGLTGRLAESLGAKVFAPDYCQAPDFPFPAPIDDVFAAYRALLASGVDPKKLVLVGDSAGGATP